MNINLNVQLIGVRGNVKLSSLTSVIRDQVINDIKDNTWSQCGLLECPDACKVSILSLDQEEDE